MKHFTKNDVMITAKNFAFVIIGTLILTFGVAVFLVPFDLVTGGISGIAIILHRIFLNLNVLQELSVDTICIILTWTLFALGWLVLGNGFAGKTLLSTCVYSLSLPLFTMLVDGKVFDGFFFLAGSQYGASALILASLFSGVCVGTGCALTFLGGGSTGGVDVLAFILCKVFKKLKNSVSMFIIDGSTVVFGMFIIGDFVLALLGIVAVFVSAMMIDKVFLGGRSAFIAQIVSDKYEEINTYIIEKLDRTTTILQGEGGYSRTDKKLMMVSFTMNEYADLLAAVLKIDKKAFITVHRAHEISGEGWTIEKRKKG